MTKSIKFPVSNYNSLDSDRQAALEAELETLKGVDSVKIDASKKTVFIDYEEAAIDLAAVRQVFKNNGCELAVAAEQQNQAIKETTYFVSGMHCASCEILIEKKILGLGNIKSVEASAGKGLVTIEYKGDKLSLERLNKIFRSDHYVFSDHNQRRINTGNSGRSDFWKNFVIAGLIVVGFLALNKLGLARWINVDAKSSLAMFFAFGLLAGVSSCAALVGGLILSMSKQWSEIYQNEKTAWRRIQPHLLFNAGRLLSYGLLGAILGAIGSKLQFSLTFTSVLTLLVSVIMIGLGLQMFGVKAFRKFQFTMPKFITRYISDEKNFQGRYMPFVMGALTFFLPCGFTITAQGLALISGSALQGSLIMFLFALGTLVPLLFIGFSSIKFSENPRRSGQFLKVAGLLVLFFALFNINAQLNVLGFSSLSDLKFGINQSDAAGSVANDLPPIIDGKQVVKMSASSSGYSPNYFKVRVGVPVRWEITDTGTSGCTNAIISKSLFDGSIPLTPGNVSVKEFTPQQVGKYKFSCWMGMVSGVIEVVGKSGSVSAAVDSAKTTDAVIPSGAKGCGCGGGGGSSCGAK